MNSGAVCAMNSIATAYFYANQCGMKVVENVAKQDLNPKFRREIETCFAAGTLVHTKEGLRPIEELKVGDLVLTWPEDMPIPIRPRHPFRLPDEYIYKPITKTFVHEDTMISHVLILGTGNRDDETLRVTPNHPVYAERRGWLPVSELKPSNALIWADFSNTSFRKARHDVERVTVYNIEVEDCHTYFVGKRGLWVHNKGESVTEIGAIRDVQQVRGSEVRGSGLALQHCPFSIQCQSTSATGASQRTKGR